MQTSKEQFMQERELEDVFEDSFTKEEPGGPLTTSQLAYLESLITTSLFDERQRQDIEMNFSALTVEEATKLIEYLKDNQQDKFTQSSNYSITELYAKVREIYTHA